VLSLMNLWTLTNLPIIQAPMAGVQGSALAIAVANAGGLGSLPCAMYGPDAMRAELAAIRSQTSNPINVNFFCHTPPAPDEAREAKWQASLAPYYRELGIDPDQVQAGPQRRPFSAETAEVLAEFEPAVVSFHFGLPSLDLLARVRQAGCLIMSSATTAAEARWLEEHGVDAVIAQGYEAGGHRGMFLTDDIAAQVGTFALVPQVVDAVKVPVIAAGGVSDARGIAAAFALGAAGVQIGTAYLHTPESKISAPHRTSLSTARDDGTALTNLMTGRPARGLFNRVMREIGPIADIAPAFPLAAGALAPLRAKAEAQGSGDFSPLWAGQAAALGRAIPAGELTRKLADEAQRHLSDFRR
jgi:nitronate monooxygenase